jgi:hypothetical protein
VTDHVPILAIGHVKVQLDAQHLPAGALPCLVPLENDVLDFVDGGDAHALAQAQLRLVLEHPVVVPVEDVDEVAPGGVDGTGACSEAGASVEDSLASSKYALANHKASHNTIPAEIFIYYS